MEHIQSILFDKDYFTVKQAENFIKKNPKFKMAKPPHVTNSYIRIRQKDPDYDKFYYKTKKNPNHTEFIIGYPIKKKGGANEADDEDEKDDRKKRPLKEAKKIANKYVKVFKNMGIKLHLVGSILRKEPMVKDIDFITTDPLDKKGSLAYTVLDENSGIYINIWKIDNLKFSKLIYGYPKHVIIALRKSLKDKGYTLSNNELLKNGKPTKIKSAKKIFELAEIKYRPITSK